MGKGVALARGNTGSSPGAYGWRSDVAFLPVHCIDRWIDPACPSFFWRTSFSRCGLRLSSAQLHRAKDRGILSVPRHVMRLTCGSGYDELCMTTPKVKCNVQWSKETRVAIYLQHTPRRRRLNIEHCAQLLQSVRVSSAKYNRPRDAERSGTDTACLAMSLLRSHRPSSGELQAEKMTVKKWPRDESGD